MIRDRGLVSEGFRSLISDSSGVALRIGRVGLSCVVSCFSDFISETLQIYETGFLVQPSLLDSALRVTFQLSRSDG